MLPVRLVRSWQIVAAVGAMLLAFGASHANAAQRYAAPPPASGTCSQAAPCSLQTAVESANPNDEVIVAPGTYPEGSNIISMSDPGLFVHGAAGAPKPTIQSSASVGFQISGTGSRLTDVRIVHTAADTQGALSVGGNAQVSRIEAIGTGVGCYLNDLAVIRDSLCSGGSATYESGLAAYLGSNGTVRARNVTATGRSGVYVGTSAAAATAITVDLRNMIMFGTVRDIDGINFPGSTTTVTIQDSNFDTVASALTPANGFTVPAAGTGTNQMDAPSFVDVASGNYRQTSTSPTIDQGATDSLTGTSDLDGVPRPQGAAIDIGAFEYTEPVPAPPPNPAADTTPPATTIDKGPKKKSKSKKATFTFSAEETGATFECKLDKGVFEACTSPAKYKRLKRGKHSFAVQSIDAAGNTDTTPATYRWKVKKKGKK